jgi:hypothetical protein
MTKIINGNQTAKGAGHHFLAIACVAVGLTAASLGLAGCPAPTGSTIENPSKYDNNGWTIEDATDLQNKNGTLYDNDGYNRGGYDISGYDRQGLDKDGNPKEQGGAAKNMTITVGTLKTQPTLKTKTEHFTTTTVTTGADMT